MRELLEDGTISGYGLIQNPTAVQCAFGTAVGLLLKSDASSDASGVAGELYEAMTEDKVPEDFRIEGATLVTLRREDDAAYALSQNKDAGLILYKLKIGVLVVRFGLPSVVHVVVPKVERAVLALR